MERKYKRCAPIGGKKPILVIVEDGKITDNNPSKEELKELKEEPYNGNNKPRRITYCSTTEICPRCIEEGKVTKKSVLYLGNACLEKNKDRKGAVRYICNNCNRRDYYNKVEKYDPNSWNNIKKSIANCRTGNQNPNHSSTKGDQDIELICELYCFENLNKTNDNYSTGTPIDCCDNKTGLLYQSRGRRYDRMKDAWVFADFDDEWRKEYKGMICICRNKDGNIVERIYIFPSEVIKGVRSIGIHKNPMNTKGTGPIDPWYEEYRVKDLNELKKANDILKKILEKIK